MKKIYIVLGVILQFILTIMYFAVFKLAIQFFTKGGIDLISLIFIIVITLIIQLITLLLAKYREKETNRAIEIAHTSNNKYGWLALLIFLVIIFMFASFIIEENIKRMLTQMIIVATGLIFVILIFKNK